TDGAGRVRSDVRVEAAGRDVRTTGPLPTRLALALRPVDRGLHAGFGGVTVEPLALEHVSRHTVRRSELAEHRHDESEDHQRDEHEDEAHAALVAHGCAPRLHVVLVVVVSCDAAVTVKLY